MKTTMYYFSGTGNSLHAAKCLAQELGETTLISIGSVAQQSSITVQTDRVGFVFPLYFWGVPEIVADVIKKMDLGKSTYIFTVITRGGSPGYTINRIEQLLAAKGKTLNVGCHLTMLGNYILPFYYKFTNLYESPEKQRKQLENADKKLLRIANVIKNNGRMVQRNHMLLNGVTKAINKLFYTLYLGDLGLWDKKYHVDGKCNGCGTCEKVCPVKNIVLSDGKPQWQHHCTQCMGCIQLCPQQAIQFAQQTAHKLRYRHPKVALKELMGQS